jgi:NAD-dependent dihydropyrimidine dehydrogenase PreA subunit
LVRVLLKFSKGIVDQPITSQIIIEKGIPINILSAHINQRGGEIIADIPSDQANKAIKAFREKGVTVDVSKLIEVDEKCVDCGACISLCPVTAIAFDKDFSVVFDENKCIGTTCSLCVDACPVRAIRLIG